MAESKLGRRGFLKRAAGGLAAVATASLAEESAPAAPHIKSGKVTDKVFVLGLDGMDPVLLRRFVARGEMPAFARLMEQGYCGQLTTTMPAQSLVAWSSFIAGTNPGGHGIFDFVHRQPAPFMPHFSTARQRRGEHALRLGSWALPLEGGSYELLRRGPTLWEVLEERDIAASVFKIPANFPVGEGRTQALSGMGTPDLLGTYGTFTYFTDADVPGADDFSGGRVVRVRVVDHVVRSALEGPPNPLRADGAKTRIEFKVYRDPSRPAVRIEIQDRTLVMRQGEWSAWLPLKFELMPLFSGISGMVRIYVQEVHPHFRLYLSPINVDPMDPELPVANPVESAQALARHIGRFYTQGFPEDTKALSHGVFDDEEFLAQSRIVLEERLRAFDWEIDRFDEGLFFFYVSSLDQNSHMLYRAMDPAHPLHDPDAAPEVKQAVYHTYRAMDAMLARTMARMDAKSVLLALSDHGFAPFVREFHLSTWLVENGYTVLADPGRAHQGRFYENVDWSQTQAFALGLNGIYINAEGREANGAVPPAQVPRIKAQIIAGLNALRDPQNGARMIRKAYASGQIYAGPFADLAPDIAVGYEGGYRISDGAALGAFPRGIVGDRTDKWSADHCLEPGVVPGVLLSNRGVTRENPAIWDLTPSILQCFGVPVPGAMDGRPVLSL